MTTSDSRLRAAFAEAERRGLLLTTRLRLAILAVLALWLPVENAWRSLLFYYPFLVGFALIGLAPQALRRAGLDAPRVGSHDATQALRFARAIIGAVEAWNTERARRTEAPIAIGVGVHYGPVAIGDVGDRQYLAFAVVGDTVNVASRLQSLTRVLGVSLVVSKDLIDAARAEGILEARDLEGLQPIESQ